ncbi:MAG: sulfatase-like hydrolase/transferase, partial [Planctomycetota bacterium]
MPFKPSFLLMIFLLSMVASVRAERPPNIVVILADDLGCCDMNLYGGWVETPNLAKMASEGMLFTDFHTNSSVCSPTRAAFLTGRYQQRAGVPSVINADPAKPEHYWGLQPVESTLPERLAEAGYRSGIFGKWHLGYGKSTLPMINGFHEFRGYVSGNIDYHSHKDRMGVDDWWHNLDLKPEEGYCTHLITKHATKFIR